MAYDTPRQIIFRMMLSLIAVVSAASVDEYHQHLANYVDHGRDLPSSKEEGILDDS